MAYTELQEDTKIKASVLNANFQAMKDYAQELISASDTTLDAKIEATKTSLTNSYNSLNAAAVKTSGNQSIAGNKTFTGTSTFNGTTKVPASTATGTALRLSGRGTYSIKLGDGTIINWGHKKTANWGISYEINFQIPFSDTNYSLSLTEYYTDGGTYTPYITKLNKGSAVIHGDNNRTVYWIAVGR